MRPLRCWIYAMALLAATAARADLCSVPGSRATLAAALLDATCTEIALAAQSYNESPAIDRDVTITGAGSTATTIVGQITVEGTGTFAALVGLTVDASQVVGAPEAITVGTGAETTMANVVARGPSPATDLFADGFESGDMSAWDLLIE